MKLAPLLSLVFLAVAFPTALSAEAKPEVVNLEVPKAGKMAVRIPLGWKHKLTQVNPTLPPTMEVSSPRGTLTLMMTFMADTAGKFGTKESVDQLVTVSNRAFVEGSVEKKLTLTQLESKLGHGAYATFTDAEFVRKPVGPGQFKFVTSGVIAFKKQFATFTVLTNESNGADYKEALKVVSEGISVP